MHSDTGLLLSPKTAIIRVSASSKLVAAQLMLTNDVDPFELPLLQEHAIPLFARHMTNMQSGTDFVVRRLSCPIRRPSFGLLIERCARTDVALGANLLVTARPRPDGRYLVTSSIDANNELWMSQYGPVTSTECTVRTKY